MSDQRQRSNVGILFSPETLDQIDDLVKMLNDSAINLETSRSEFVRAFTHKQINQLDDPAENAYQIIEEYREEMQ